MTAPWLSDPDADVYLGDCRDVLRDLPDSCAACCVTSPPYLDARPEYPSLTAAGFGAVFSELVRVVDGPIMFNVGRLWRSGVEITWWYRLLEEARRVGLELLDTLVWIKPNSNPIQGRVFANAHEYVFVLGTPALALDVDEIRRPYAEGTAERLARRWVSSISVKGDNAERNGARRDDRRGETREGDMHPDGARPRSYVEITTGREKGNPHPAPMPKELARHLILLGARAGETVLDPFAGSGTTALVARELGRRSVSIELLEEYGEMIARRLGQQTLLA